MDEDGSPSEMVKNFFKQLAKGPLQVCVQLVQAWKILVASFVKIVMLQKENEIDESLQRYFGVADWAIDTMRHLNYGIS